MSVAILYRNPKRPDEVGVAVVPDPKAARICDR
jgi:hypothetical protein